MRVSLKDLKAARARSRKSGRRHSPLAEAEAAIGQGVNAGIGEALSHVLRKREGLLIRGINVPLRKKRFFQGLEMSTSADIEFMRFGVQYYVAARYAALAGLLSVCGNLYHHALEMFLKAGLSRQLSLESLKSKKFRHKLIDIWNAFKVDFPSPELLQFDTTIADIDDFEEIRYPDEDLKNGAQKIVDWGSIPPRSSASEPMYRLHVNDLDCFIGEIFRASSRNPLFFTSGLSRDAREVLARDNPIATQLLGN